MPKNYDRDVQRKHEPQDLPVSQSNFTNDPLTPRIFWGPNQLNTGFTFYNAPSNWRDLEQLNIPQVIRFLHNGDTDYDTEEFDDPGGGGPPLIYTWKVTNYGHNGHWGNGVIFVDWTLQQAPFPWVACPTGLIDTPANYLQVQMTYPLGTVKQSSSNVFPCGDVM